MAQSLKDIVIARGDKHINLVDMLAVIDAIQTSASNKNILKSVFVDCGDKYINIVTMNTWLDSVAQLNICTSSEVVAAKNVINTIGDKLITLPAIEAMFDVMPSISSDTPVTQYTINVLSNDTNMGTVSGGGTFNAGATVTIIATAKSGYRFVKWNDNNTNATRTITVNSNKTYTATFEVESQQTNDYYIGWSSVARRSDFTALSDEQIKTGIVGYSKVANPSYNNNFGESKKTIYLLYKSDSVPTHAYLNKESDLPTEYTAAMMQDDEYWKMTHEAVTIDGISYSIIGLGSSTFTSDDTIEVWFNNGWQ